MLKTTAKVQEELRNLFIGDAKKLMVKFNFNGISIRIVQFLHECDLSLPGCSGLRFQCFSAGVGGKGGRILCKSGCA